MGLACSPLLAPRALPARSAPRTPCRIPATPPEEQNAPLWREEVDGARRGVRPTPKERVVATQTVRRIDTLFVRSLVTSLISLISHNVLIKWFE